MAEQLQKRAEERTSRLDRIKKWFLNRDDQDISSSETIAIDDPFAEVRDDLKKLITRQPAWLTQLDEQIGQRPPTWYIGPAGPDIVDLLNATDEEFLQYERLAAMLDYDTAKARHERSVALGIVPADQPFEWKMPEYLSSEAPI